MTRKLIVAPFLAVIFLLLSTPVAKAIDIPLLTWERGIEQNVVVGGISAKAPWDIKLLKPGSPVIAFKPSSVNRRGFLVYSGALPADLPLGNYTIEVFGDGSASGSEVAEVRVIELAHYSIASIPKDLVFLLISIVFVLSILTVSRSRKYSDLSFLREKGLVENQTLLFDKRIPRFFYPIYLLREGALSKLHPSLFKFLMLKDDALLHRISPILWGALPGVGTLFGLWGGLTSHGTLREMPYYAFLFISIISLIDSYSGIFCLFGFAFGQIVMGEVLNLRSAILIVALALSWVFTSMFSNLLFLVTEKDFPIPEDQWKPAFSGLKSLLLLISIPCFTGIYFFASLLLAESLSASFSLDHSKMVSVAIFVGAFSGIKQLIQQLMDIRSLKNESIVPLVLIKFNVVAFMKPGWVGFISVSSVFVSFIWTQTLGVALLVGFAIFGILSSFAYRFGVRRIVFLRRWRRNVLIEASINAYLVYLIFIYTQSLPYHVVLRSEIFTVLALGISLLHVIISSFYDAEKVEAVI